MKKMILICLLILNSSCSKDEEEKSYPSCFETSIENILNAPVKTKRPTIKKYSYQNKEVYILYINYYDHDILNVVDGNCITICEFGGTGGSTNTCGDLNNLVLVETVWKDPR